MNRIVIAGVQSGAGKTTVAAGIMAALSARARVQAFKCGPDYIDPSYHTKATGRPSRNLDTWMLDEASVLELFRHSARTADVSIIEGVMGLFDGKTGAGESGSTAHLTKLLRAPVVLVIDASKIARSAAAIVLGFRLFDPDLNLAGVILNRIASTSHYQALAEPIEREAGIPVVGYLPRDPALELPERYLGLIPTVEGPIAQEYFAHLSAVCERTIDIARLEAIAAAAPPMPWGQGRLFPSENQRQKTRIAVARDAAFSFYYEDNLDLLRAWGADIVEFSPLADASLPPGTNGVYIGGGFPELFAADLSANRSMHAALRTAAQSGMPIYAECGGLMYLGAQLRDEEGAEHQMVNLIPARSSMQGKRLTLGYREARALRASPLLEWQQEIRAHEFHCSTLDEEPDSETAAYVIAAKKSRQEGFLRGSLLASYMHLHFGTAPGIAQRFVGSCQQWAERNLN